MALNYYEGWSESDLLAERRRIQEAQSSGRLTSWSSPDASSGRTVEVSISVVLERIQYALFIFNAATYPYAPRIRRTRPRYV